MWIEFAGLLDSLACSSDGPLSGRCSADTEGRPTLLPSTFDYDVLLRLTAVVSGLTERVVQSAVTQHFPELSASPTVAAEYQPRHPQWLLPFPNARGWFQVS